MPKIALKIVLPVFFLVLFSSCKEGASISKEQNMPGDTPLESQTAQWPVPNYFLGEIPVYETFDEIEPLFRQRSDTTYVINFWATWCKPCIEELPYFEALNTTQNEAPTKVILVSLDFPKHLESKLVPFIEKQEIMSRVEVLLDGSYNDWIDKVSPEWSGAIPATYIYQNDKHNFVGEPFESYEDLVSSVKSIL